MNTHKVHVHRGQIVVVVAQGLRAAHVVVEVVVEVVVAMEKVLCSRETQGLADPSWAHARP